MKVVSSGEEKWREPLEVLINRLIKGNLNIFS